MKYSLLLFLSIGSVFASSDGFVHFKETNKLYLSTSLIYQAISLESEDSSSSELTSSSFTMAGTNLNIDYFYSSKWAFHFNYYIAMILSIDAEVQGFDIGVKYYLKDGASKDIEFSGSSLQMDPKYSYFLFANASTKNFQFAAVSLKFQGFELGAGFDWHLNKNYFLRAEGSLEMLFNNNIRTYSATGAAFAIGFKY
jgi:hypothetical protein